MSDGVSMAAVGAYVSGAVGSGVTEVVSLPGSVANLDYRVRLSDESLLIVKLGPASELSAEAWACRRLSGQGLPVPEVVGLDLDRGIAGRPTLLLSFLAGSASEDPSVLRQAGQFFRRVHAQHLPGWGPIVVDPPDAGGPSRPDAGGRARGRFDSWTDAVAHQLAGLPELVGAGILDAELSTAARESVLVPAIAEYSGPGVLLHNDLKPVHLFAATSATDHLTGVIDWGDATVGDPLADLARLSMTGAAALAAFSEGYGIELTPAVHDLLARYRIAWNVAALTYEYRAGGDWFDTYRRRIADDVRLR